MDEGMKSAFRDSHQRGTHKETHPREAKLMRDHAERIGIARNTWAENRPQHENNLTREERWFMVDFFTQPELMYVGYYAKNRARWAPPEDEDSDLKAGREKEYEIIPRIMPKAGSMNMEGHFSVDDDLTYIDGAFAYTLRYKRAAKGKQPAVEAPLAHIGFDVDLKEKTIYINQIHAGTTHTGSMKANWQRDALNRIEYRQLLYDMVYELALRQGFKKIAIRRASAIKWAKVRERPEVAYRNYDGFAQKNRHVFLPSLSRMKEAFFASDPMRRRKRDYLFRDVPNISIARKGDT